ncbi:MAG TPA: cytochrome c oxidase subunit II [Candidatus Paceibacterota bacterium]|nr:cytochrome c oxidase subunit II [Verrucomicrobiota bacterium]HSA11039.1 cytochrome c oxidase subunit II [Candidatus Paceibacterota bacterium]
MMQKLLGLPPVASEHGHHVDDLIIYLHWLMGALFVGWLIYFTYTLIRFRRARNPKADYTGVRNHASSYVECAVAAVEGVLLVFIAVPLWAQAVDKFPDKKDSTVIHVVGQQFNWNALYADKDGEFGRQDMRFVSATNTFGLDPSDPRGKENIQIAGLGEMHVPVNKPVICYISSKDVIHSFKVIAMRVTQDAIPGLRIPMWFKPIKEGRYQINCAQLCGNAHAAMSSGMLVVESQAAYDKWLASKVGAATSFE